MTTTTLFDALSAIPDHRTMKGRRFPLATILTIALAAMLSGADDLMAIFRWGRRLSPQALQALGASKKRKKAPCHATYHYVFQALSADDLRAALGVLVNTEGGLGHVAIKPAPASEPGASVSAAASTTTAPHLRRGACTCCMPSRPSCRRPSDRSSCRPTAANVSKRSS